MHMRTPEPVLSLLYQSPRQSCLPLHADRRINNSRVNRPQERTAHNFAAEQRQVLRMCYHLHPYPPASALKHNDAGEPRRAARVHKLTHQWLLSKLRLNFKMQTENAGEATENACNIAALYNTHAARDKCTLHAYFRKTDPVYE